jgi:ABC-2 type transport system permease protein
VTVRERLIRTGSFIRGELVTTLRQPRLLLALVLGPFLVLFVFGLGYEDRLPTLATLVVGADEDQLTRQVDDYIRRAEPAEIDYEGTTSDRDAALRRLRDGGIDLVIALPEGALDSIGASEQAVIEVHQRSLDPITYYQVVIAAEFAINEINDDILEQVLSEAQDQTDGVEEQLAMAREELDAIRAAIGEQDVALVQTTAGQLAERFTELATTLESGGGFVSQLGFGGDLDEVVTTLRQGAEQLEALTRIDAITELDDAAVTLAEVDDVVTFVRGIDPAVAARPFDAEMHSATPVAVTLDRFYAPGLIALMLQHLGITFAALSLVREREAGTLDMLRVAPVTTGERLAGKSLAFLLLGGITAVALTVLSVVAFDVPLPADWLGYTLIIALTLLASLGIGYLVASVSRTHSQAVQYCMLLLLTAIFFSGLFMPLERIGMPVEAVSWLLPATYGFVGLQHLMLLLRPAPTELFLGLVAIAVVTFGLARILLPRRMA